MPDGNANKNAKQKLAPINNKVFLNAGIIADKTGIEYKREKPKSPERKLMSQLV